MGKENRGKNIFVLLAQYYNYTSVAEDWDIDGTLQIQEKCRGMWDAGYRCALVPDYAIEGGCVYCDGSFSLVSDGILKGEPKEFNFEIDGIKYSGHHTGLLAYRSGSFAFATDGSQLFVGNQKIELKKIQE